MHLMFLLPFLLLCLVRLGVSNRLVKRWDNLNMVKKHSWEKAPSGWESVRSAPADHMLNMRVALNQHRFDELEQLLWEVSDPTHKKYGAHLSKTEVEKLMAPHPESSRLVQEWLTHHGIDPKAIQRSSAGDWIALSINVSTAERMLDTKYNLYHDPVSLEYVVRTLSYSLPSALHPHIDVVTPTTYFGTLKSMKVTSFLQPNGPTLPSDHLQFSNPADHAGLKPDDECNSTITPLCLMNLYKTASYKPTATDKNSLGVTGYLEEFASHADLRVFLQKFRPDAVSAEFNTVSVNGGGDNQSDPGFEANLDMQYPQSLTFPTRHVFYSTAGSPPFNPDSETPENDNEPYLDWLNFMLAQQDSDLPRTVSTSYADYEQTVPYDYAHHVCKGFAALGARGVSLLFSSGDTGVGGGKCTANDGSNKVRFQPVFPASCPYVTAVGATLQIPEVAGFFSGGGFSDHFSRPAFQDAAASKFFTYLGDQYTGLYNKNGRMIPDTAAQGFNYQIVVNGTVGSISGTSASTPTFASIVVLLNDCLLSKNRSPLGFLNPLLYTRGINGFNDITSGNNPGCGTPGFNATEGWDPVTGLGTPDFERLKKIVGCCR